MQVLAEGCIDDTEEMFCAVRSALSTATGASPKAVSEAGALAVAVAGLSAGGAAASDFLGRPLCFLAAGPTGDAGVSVVTAAVEPADGELSERLRLLEARLESLDSLAGVVAGATASAVGAEGAWACLFFFAAPPMEPSRASDAEVEPRSGRTLASKAAGDSRSSQRTRPVVP